MKKLQRIIEKLGPDASSGKIFDLNRFTLLCNNEEEFKRAIWNIPLVFAAIRKLKNKFKLKSESIGEPPCLFYQVELRDQGEELTELLELGKRWIVEIQVTTPQFFDTKSLCHATYEILRASELPAPSCPVCTFSWVSTNQDPQGQGPQEIDNKLCFCLIGATGA